VIITLDTCRSPLLSGSHSTQQRQSPHIPVAMLSGDTTVDEFCAGLANLYVPRKYIMYGTAKQQECNSKDKLLKCVSTLQIVGNHLAHGKTSRSRLQYKNKSIRISHLTLKGVGFMGHKSSQYSDSLQAGKVGD